MQLLTDEKIISISDDYTVTLTTHRISQEHRSFSTSTGKSIMLENIATCGSYRKRSWMLLVISLIAVVVAVVSYGLRDHNTAGAAGAMAFLVFMAFFLFQWEAIVITSPSAVMQVNVLGMNRRKVKEFIEQVEEARQDRLDFLRQKVS